MKITSFALSAAGLCAIALLGACGANTPTTGASPADAMSAKPAASSAMSNDAMSPSAMKSDDAMSGDKMSGDTMMKAKAYVTYDEWMKSMDSFKGHKLIAIHIGTDAAAMTLDKALMKADTMTQDSMAKSGDTMMGDALPKGTTVIKVTDAMTAATLMIDKPGMAVELDAMGKPMKPFAVTTLADLTKGMMR